MKKLVHTINFSVYSLFSNRCIIGFPSHNCSLGLLLSLYFIHSLMKNVDVLYNEICNSLSFDARTSKQCFRKTFKDSTLISLAFFLSFYINSNCLFLDQNEKSKKGKKWKKTTFPSFAWKLIKS